MDFVKIIETHYTSRNKLNINDIIYIENYKIYDETIIYSCKDKYSDYIIKETNDDFNIVNKFKFIKKILELDVSFYEHYLCKFNDKYVWLMEKMIHVNKSQVFDMLECIIPKLFKWRHLMCHSDIKPDNIMYSHKYNEYHLIDFDNIAISKFSYGFMRNTFTPNFSSQSSKGFHIITVKQDLIELIWSAHSIYYNTLDITNVIRFNKIFKTNCIFSSLLLFIMNLNEKLITLKDQEDILNILFHLKNIVLTRNKLSLSFIDELLKKLIDQ